MKHRLVSNYLLTLLSLILVTAITPARAAGILSMLDTAPRAGVYRVDKFIDVTTVEYRRVKGETGPASYRAKIATFEVSRLVDLKGDTIAHERVGLPTIAIRRLLGAANRDANFKNLEGRSFLLFLTAKQAKGNFSTSIGETESILEYEYTLPEEVRSSSLEEMSAIEVKTQVYDPAQPPAIQIIQMLAHLGVNGSNNEQGIFSCVDYALMNCGKDCLKNYQLSDIRRIVCDIYWADSSWLDSKNAGRNLDLLAMVGDPTVGPIIEREVRRDPTCAKFGGACPSNVSEDTKLFLIEQAPAAIVRRLVDIRDGWSSPLSLLSKARARFGENDELDITILQCAYRIIGDERLNITGFLDEHRKIKREVVAAYVEAAKPIIDAYLGAVPAYAAGESPL